MNKQEEKKTNEKIEILMQCIRELIEKSSYKEITVSRWGKSFK